MTLSSRSELKDQFVVGSRSFHLRFGALKSSATITLFVFNLLLISIYMNQVLADYLCRSCLGDRKK